MRDLNSVGRRTDRKPEQISKRSFKIPNRVVENVNLFGRCLQPIGVTEQQF
jgi:hypothetical protein